MVWHCKCYDQLLTRTGKKPSHRGIIITVHTDDGYIVLVGLYQVGPTKILWAYEYTYLVSSKHLGRLCFLLL